MITTTPAGSPTKTSKIKFLCSHGGKIMLRPPDAVLKYVGGQTRVLSVPRNIDFTGLTKKIATLKDGNVILKYQLIHEDLDALVTVRSNEDLRFMIDECQRYELIGAPRLRAFLFPTNTIVTETTTPNLIDPHALEQHYIDAVNGVFRTGTKYSYLGHRPYSVPVSSSSGSSSTPNSVDSNSALENTNNAPEAAIRLQNYITSKLSLHRVQSSPTISNLVNHHHYHHHHSHHHCSGHQSPQNVGSGYQSPVMVQYNRQMTMPTPPRTGGCKPVEWRKVGYNYPPSSTRHARSSSVSGYLQNEEYFVERRLETEDWFSRMIIQPSTQIPFSIQ
ncbi:uncharacterized protein LOC124919000 [Impatiens glandulifera]|uniref:uncharacterized protein LOC124919000 n=1 Tax=Impatiens glandulifera TaxID=253017 RepID=UPI001FB064FA|nr:uncharacterized protein LOC124919000 [Impatiens glandulifera]